MSDVHSFAPVCEASAKILILGSIPGKASLKAQKYYAHPRNLFWPFISEILDKPLPDDYQDRCKLLTNHHIAVWDVLKTCRREGSLDAAIIESSIIPNHLFDFIEQYNQINAIFFNGTKAHKSFNRYLADKPEEQIRVTHRNIALVPLPSTSPANAAISRSSKLEQWSNILQYL